MNRTVLFGAVVIALVVSSTAIAKESTLVTCGSLIKLINDQTKHFVTSLDVTYGSGSGQHVVVGSPSEGTSESMWIVKKNGCRQGSPIKNGEEIKLQHMGTRRWLHSHLFGSPLSGQQEISCFGDEAKSDTGDIWIIEWDDRQDYWVQDQKIRLKHKDTGAYLSSHAMMFRQPIAGRTEIFGSKKSGKPAVFRAGEGVFFGITVEKR